MKTTKRTATKPEASTADRDGLELFPVLLRMMRGLYPRERERVTAAIEAEMARLGRETLFQAAMANTPPTSAPNPIERSNLWLEFASSSDPAARARALAVLTALADPDDLEVIEALAARLGPDRGRQADPTRAACAAASAQQLHRPTH